MEQQTASTKQWIDRVLEALEEEELGDRLSVAREFGRQLLARASAELLERRDAREIAADVAGLFRFVEGTPPGQITVRVRPVAERAHRATIETVMPDCPFVVNTLRELVHELDFRIVHLLHPVLVISRDEEGKLTAVEDRSAEGPRTSVVHLVVEDHVDAEVVASMEDEIRHRLEQVRVVTRDFKPMVERSREVVEGLEEKKDQVPWRAGELEEVQELLRWLADGAFVFLGYREYDVHLDEEMGERFVQVAEGTGLGILREESRSQFAEPVSIEELAPQLRARVVGGPLLIVSKTNSLSPVHRRARMDYIGVKKVGSEGEIRGERRFLGLFTARAYAQDASTIPILRRKLQEILQAEGVARGSHDYNRILQIFNSLPKEELFLASVSELLNLIGAVMETEGADEVRVIPRSDALQRGVHVLVMIPQDRFSEEVRRKIVAHLLESYRGEVLNYHLTMAEGDQARLHFYLSSELEEPDEVDVAGLEARVRRAVRNWEERLSDELEKAHEIEEAHQLADRHRQDFTEEYKAATDATTAVEDIDRLESLAVSGLQQITFTEVSDERPEASLLKVFAPRGMYVLSDLMPTLENLGLRVLAADKYDIRGRDGRQARSIHRFEVETPSHWGIDREEAAPRMVETLRAIEAGQTEDDELNSLVLSTGLGWRPVALLRSYAGYAFRISAVTSRAGVRRPLAEHPGAARLLYRIFEAGHDPEREEGREARLHRLREQFDEVLDEVRSIEHDRTYRRLLNLVESTVRTNFFRPAADDRYPGMIALKFDCERIEVMPAPRPRFEIYVNSGHCEGAHLRMGRVARGGIRWSDRSEDFRVEVLGLVKTQQVKNSVIVPVGAKGAYIAKNLPTGAEDLREIGDRRYEEFISGLLDVTDNVVDGELVHPERMVVRDDPDPYLVVAADKGTAHLSDVANRLAGEYDFWLGDAFASGGSHGYDHKELGITARGAWECVKRHFRELGVDVQRHAFTVVGIGDMSGDVFGNGMLLSRQIRLVAAFDHRHVFLDPDPDPARSWEERRRLFGLEGSTWRDYDEELISEGGGVHDRDAKEIELSREVRDLLDLEEEVTNGEELIRAILRADVDLLWNGGIGTYVKASDETHGEVGDPGNDDVRVDADELRASVVGEGGNLGLTQRARIEYALRGGRINTDALDNSGGVDMSDHEVNLKVLLDAAVAAGRIGEEERNELLAEVTEEVTERVLRNNYMQSLAVSLDENRVREIPAEFRDTLTRLEREGILDRTLAELPGTEQLDERHEASRYLTRPELAILLAYAKTHLKEALLDSDLPEREALDRLLRAYFPGRVVETVGVEALRKHPLDRRIVATLLANRFVDRMGITAHVELVRETGRGTAAVLESWYAAHRIGRTERLHRRLREMDGEVPAGVQTQWFLRLSEVLERATRWLLSNDLPDRTISESIQRFREPVAELREALPDLLIEERRRELEGLRALHETDGLKAGVAEELASFEYLDALLPVADLARSARCEATRVGEVYFGLTAEIDFSWLQDQLGRVSGADLWEQRAAKTLSLQLDAARTRITEKILSGLEDADTVEVAMEEFRERHGEELERVRQVIGDVRAADRVSLSALMVAVHAIAEQGAARNGGR